MAAPSAPTVRAQGTGQGSVRVQVQDVEGATSYRLYRSSDAAFSDEAILTASPAVRGAWTFDKAVGYAEDYWYRADATNADGTSAKGAAVRVTVIQDSPRIHLTAALQYERTDR